MHNICIIGGSGFLGSRLIAELMSVYTIMNLDLLDSARYPSVTHIADVCDDSSLIDKLHGQDLVVLLAAEHKDNVSPASRYYDVNVTGMKNVLHAMDVQGIKNIIFTSSVSIFGMGGENLQETSNPNPFNHYGKSKWQAEEILKQWYESSPEEKSILILRPTVIFGEHNRGNVYNLFKQIATGKFFMVGNGQNIKSLAYVGNLVAFIKNRIDHWRPGCFIYNYSDKPDFTTRELVDIVYSALGKKKQLLHIPYWMGVAGGYGFDIMTILSRREYSVSAVRIKKFCATTHYSADKISSTGFIAPYSLRQAIIQTVQKEFL
jgi:GlcNAc-P-P-Und epimerase